MMCERCDELAERVAWLESELGLQRDVEAADHLHRRMRQRATHGQPIRPQAALLVLALYRAKGRPLSQFQILEAIPPRYGDVEEDERIKHLVAVLISHIRRALGYGAIGTVWGKGYYLTPEGMETVASLLPSEQARAA